MKCSMGIIVSNLLLLQLTVALPKRGRREAGLAMLTLQQYSNFASNKPAAYERRELFTATLGEMTILAKFTVQQGVALFKNTLQELNTLPEEQRATLQANITRMSEFVKNAEDVDILNKPENILQLFQNMQQFGLILQDVAEEPTEASEIILNGALNASGLKKFEAEFEKQFTEFYSEFNQLLEAFLKNLFDEEKEAFPSLMEWIIDFKAETDLIKKHEKFELFFVLLAKGY